jgi:Right handed beta helix region
MLQSALRSLGKGLWVCVCAAAVSMGHAANYYVDTKGSDGASGSLEAPFASLQKGHDRAAAGDTVFLRGGTYKYTGKGATSISGVALSKSGQSDAKRICFFAYKNEVPVLDFAGLSISSTETAAGILVTGRFLHLKGLEITGTPNNGIWANGGSDNTYELLNLHHNKGPGLSIANGTGGNLILNCDSHDNFDNNPGQGNGENADGFGLHYQASGPATVFRGCRSWYNSDDGYDFFKQEVAAVMENCWAYRNGYSGSGTVSAGNGAGFKMGHTFNGVRHTIRDCVAWKNKAQGFYANHSDGGSDWYNNTAYENGVAFDMLADSPLSGAKIHKLRNNIAYPYKFNNIGASDVASNSWNLGVTLGDDDFLSVSDAGWLGARQADGGVPYIPFLKLRAGSDLIDKGVDVGLAMVGNAPDLGAYEYNPDGVGIRLAPSGRTVGKSSGVFIGPAGFAVDGIRIFDLQGKALKVYR